MSDTVFTQPDVAVPQEPPKAAEQAPVFYDPNVGEAESAWGARLPILAGMHTEDSYARQFCQEVEPAHSPVGILKSMIAKALKRAPETAPWSRIAAIPDSINSGVVEWPGTPPSALKQLVKDHMAAKVIIGMRCDDVQRYAELSEHPWKPGWSVVMRQARAEPDDNVLKEIREAEMFLLNCNAETGMNVRRRDDMGYTNFATFLGILARDSLTYDGMATWTDMDSEGRVRGFKAMNPANIRLTERGKGFHGDKTIFAVGVDEANAVKETYTRDKLVWKVRNPRSDADVQDYGWSEVDQGLVLLQGFTNALDMNLDTFTKNSTPNGILLAKGNWLQKQLDVLSRVWANLKRGTSKTWALPAIAVPKDGDLELLDLSRMKGNDAYYKDLMNMLAGLLCALFRFPVSRLGYKISGDGADAKVDPATSSGVIVDEDDPGRAPFLGHIERYINEYLLWSRWPHLMFRFHGKNPKEDAREYEARMNAMTLDEIRANLDLEPIVKRAKGPNKEIAELMGLCPKDPGLSGVYQAVIAAILSDGEEGEGGEPPKPGAKIGAKKDPAKSEAHGHTSGVRRDSKAEATSAGK